MRRIAGLAARTTCPAWTSRRSATPSRSGAQIWARSYQPPAGVNVPQGVAAAGVSPDGASVYVTGGAATSTPRHRELHHACLPGGHRAGLVGVPLQGPRNFGFATSLAVGPTGQGVFVTGYIGVHDGCCNFGTVAYQP